MAVAALLEGATIVGTGPRVIVTTDYGTDGMAETYHLYGQGSETGGTIIVNDQWDQSQVENRWAVVQGDVSPGIALALVTLEKVPNDGLTAGGHQLVIRTYDVNGAKVGQQATPVRENFGDESLQEVGLLGNTLVLLDNGLTQDNGNDTFADAIDVTTGALLWSKPCGSGYVSTTPMYAGGSTVALGCDSNGVRGFNLTTGETVWEYAGGRTQDFDFDRSAPGILSAAEYSGSADVTIDLINGTKIVDEGRANVLGDPITGLQTMGRLAVYDPVTQATVLSIPSDTIDQLGDFTPISAFDGRLTFMASDGLNVVSLTTGTADPSSPAKSAEKQSYTTVVADAGTGWVLIGSIGAGWDPDSWLNASPVTPYAVAWATGADGAVTWEDIAGPSIN
ncbi:outer membrane protein assembly factor BamB family protein [Pengzhenrongella sicca]|uniref:PQQ-binding-like beta-propeller repeat protein n=1 Tax=Pengzhenrongella sicca TaxID=2819238 RepID=A0A8A4ZII0_9MICO|nr:PQQ-binding-like beta-propeller repeat protein [Pengzhenrongella sicca]QTE30327.1 PQQ-binding-like beta-propeller repeat protein [Pengzhenrongella sicca]